MQAILILVSAQGDLRQSEMKTLLLSHFIH